MLGADNVLGVARVPPVQWDARLLRAYRQCASPEGSATLVKQIEHCEHWLRERPNDAEIALALGVLIGALLELRDRTFHSAEDVVEVLNLPVIGQLPYVPIDEDVSRAHRSRLIASAAVVATVAVGGVGFWALELWKYVV